MIDVKPTRTVCRGRLFPEYTMSPEEIAAWKAEREALRQRCRVIFDILESELIKTRYNWFIVIEPESGDYVIDKDEEVAARMARTKHPGTTPLFLFRINETGVSGTI